MRLNRMTLKTSLKVALVCTIGVLTPNAFHGSDAQAAGADAYVTDYDFSFEGPFGAFDRAQLQRGWQIYSQVCSGCHAMKYLSYRNLMSETGPGFSEAQVKAMIADYVVEAGPNVDGDMFERPATLADRFVSPFPNAEAATAANGGAYPPDLSLMAKARSTFHDGVGVKQLFKGLGGTEYLASLMTGYRDAPACAEGSDIGGYYNISFPSGGIPASCKDDHGVSTVSGSWISMAPPLVEGIVDYQGENVEASVEQMSKDVAAFLMWSAEPKLVERKQAGLRNIGFLIIFAILLWYSNKKLWKPLKNKKY